MKTIMISSINCNSLLRNSVESVTQFSWEAVHEELLKHMPTLMAVLSSLIPKSAERKPLECLIASQQISRDGFGAAGSISYDVWK